MKKPKPAPGAKKRGTPVAMPKKPSNSSATAKMPARPKPKSTMGPLPARPGLDDYLKRGMRPPRAPGQKKPPSDANVILKGYNDPATIKKYKKK
jgi:hypothetical protein